MRRIGLLCSLLALSGCHRAKSKRITEVWCDAAASERPHCIVITASEPVQEIHSPFGLWSKVDSTPEMAEWHWNPGVALCESNGKKWLARRDGICYAVDAPR